MPDPERPANIMTKDAAAWLAIRITGMAIGLVGLSRLVGVIYMLCVFPLVEVDSEIESKVIQNTILPTVGDTALLLLAASYFLFAGKKAHAILMKE